MSTEPVSGIFVERFSQPGDSKVIARIHPRPRPIACSTSALRTTHVVIPRDNVVTLRK